MMSGAEMLALLQDNHPAFGIGPGQILEAVRKGIPVATEGRRELHRLRHQPEKILLVVGMSDIDPEHDQSGRAGRLGKLARIRPEVEHARLRGIIQPCIRHAQFLMRLKLR